MALRQFDVALLFAFLVFATVATLLLRTSLFVSVLLYFGVPSAFLALQNLGVFLKSFSFSFILSIPLSFFIDALAAINKSWIVPTSIFSFRFFGVATLEVYCFGLLWALYAVLFYEHFFCNGKRAGRPSSRSFYLIFLSSALLLYALAGFYFNHSLLFIPYFYSTIGTLFVMIPLVLFLYFHPLYWRSFLLEGIYFFFVLFLFEIAALATKQWVFPGSEYIGYLHIFGFSMPLEEVIVWMCSATASLLSYYNYFWNDQSKAH